MPQNLGPREAHETVAKIAAGQIPQIVFNAKIRRRSGQGGYWVRIDGATEDVHAFVLPAAESYIVDSETGEGQGVQLNRDGSGRYRITGADAG